MERLLRASLIILPLFLFLADGRVTAQQFSLQDAIASLNPFNYFGIGQGNGNSRTPVAPSPPADVPKPDPSAGYLGEWELVSPNAGVSAMHMVLTHTNKAIMFDATNFGPSQVKLPAGATCRRDDKTKALDCYAHAVEFDIETANVRPLEVQTNPWCSAGSMSADGSLVQTGGWNEGTKAVRQFSPCETCDWKEYPTALNAARWYSTQQILPDGSFIIVGGRRSYNYEFIPREGKSSLGSTYLRFLWETTEGKVENNLYPFVHLSTDGNLFIFANNRSILLDPKARKVVREFPVLKGGARNYPGTSMSVLLPLNLNRRRRGRGITAEVVVCGGSIPNAPLLAAKGTYLPALRTCGRIVITNPNSVWKMEIMPSPRVMADMLLLPTGDALFINGAAKGSAGWDFAREPILEPWLYQPMKKRADRFKVLNPTTIPRMYHSSGIVLPDGKVLVAGSNPNDGYNFTNVPFVTELRVEKFSPPYLDPLLASKRPQIVPGGVTDTVKYGESFTVECVLNNVLFDQRNLTVTMYAPPFATHGFSMNQRLLFLKVASAVGEGGKLKLTVMAPPSGVIAPPGYYLVFVVYSGVPSKGAWVRIQ